MRCLLIFVTCLSISSPLLAEIRTQTVVYRDGDTVLEGLVAWNSDSTQQKLPGILVVHQWLGVTDYEKKRCKQLAELGYVAFALDIYGQGIRPESMQAAAQQSGIYKADRALYRQRLNLGLQQLRDQPGVDQDRLAAIGYCFGGTGVLELARSGANFRGGVSFHGGLDSPSPQDGKNIQASLLLCHGADDPFVPANEIQDMKAEFNAANVDWQLISYSGAVHSFTQPMAGNDNSQGAAYNEKADKRSWLAMQQFFKELFH